MENVTTMAFEKDDTTRSCSASVVLTMPAEIIGFIASYPEKLGRITRGGGKVLNNNVQWGKFVYSLSLADNGKDISVSYEYENRDFISESMADMAILALNKDEFEKSDLTNKVNAAANAYSESDSRLNQLWKYLPDSVKNSMKKEQNQWIGEKAKKCGKISDASSATTPLATRASIFNCQTQMTNERYHYLGGEDETEY